MIDIWVHFVVFAFLSDKSLRYFLPLVFVDYGLMFLLQLEAIELLSLLHFLQFLLAGL